MRKQSGLACASSIPWTTALQNAAEGESATYPLFPDDSSHSLPPKMPR